MWSIFLAPAMRGFLVASFLLITGGEAIAQQAEFEQLKVTMDRRERLLAQRVVRSMGKDASLFNDAEALNTFDRYYLEYIFPSMTYDSERALAQLATTRQRLQRELDGASYDELRQHLTKMYLEQGKKLASGNYHPAARYNAVLLIGSLYERPAQGETPPVPHRESVEFLLEAIAADSSFPEGIEIGAIVSLMRYAKWGLPAGAQQEFEAAMLRMAGEERPVTRTQDGHAWIVSLAAEALAATGKLGENNATHEVLVGIIANNSFPNWARYRATVAMVRLKDAYQNVQLDAGPAVQALAGLLVQSLKAEKKEVEEYIELRLSGMATSITGEEIDLPRKRIVFRLQTPKLGLELMKPLATPDQQAKIDEVLRDLEPLITATANDKTVTETVARRFDERAERLLDAAQELAGDDQAVEEDDKSDEAANPSDTEPAAEEDAPPAEEPEAPSEDAEE